MSSSNHTAMLHGEQHSTSNGLSSVGEVATMRNGMPAVGAVLAAWGLRGPAGNDYNSKASPRARTLGATSGQSCSSGSQQAGMISPHGNNHGNAVASGLQRQDEVDAVGPQAPIISVDASNLQCQEKLDLIFAQGQAMQEHFSELSKDVKTTALQQVSVESTLWALQAQVTDLRKYVQDDARWEQPLEKRQSRCAPQDNVIQLIAEQLDHQYRRMEEFLEKQFRNISDSWHQEARRLSQTTNVGQECSALNETKRVTRVSKGPMDPVYGLVSQANLASDVAFQNYQERMAKNGPSVEHLVQTLGWVSPSGLESSSLSSKAHVRCRQIKDAVSGFRFASVVVAVVLLNALMIAWQTNDYLARSIGKYYYDDKRLEPGWFIAIDVAFCVIFSVELLARILAADLNFFNGEERWWNFFDFALVIMAILELAIRNSMLQLTYMRLLRALRAVRILRVVKAVNYLHPLRVMLMSILNSFASLLWSFVFLSSVIFIFSVIFCQAVAHYIDRAERNEKDLVDDLRTYFPSLPAAMITLFKCMSAGRDWTDVYTALLPAGEAWAGVFVFYIAFITFGVSNVIVGMFVESASACAQKERELAMTTVMVEEGSHMNQLKKLLQSYVQESDYLSGQQYTAFFESDDARQWFKDNEIDQHEAKGLFSMLFASTDTVLIDEFIVGLTILKGGSTIDVASQWFETRQLTAQMGNFMQYTREHFLFIEQLLQRIEEPQEIISNGPLSDLNQITLGEQKPLSTIMV